MRFDILKDLGVAHKCGGQTDRRTDRETEKSLALGRSGDER